MRTRRRLAAGLTAGLLALGLAACEADPGALDDFDDGNEIEDPGAAEDM
jgi:hypothetical protein